MTLTQRKLMLTVSDGSCSALNSTKFRFVLTQEEPMPLFFFPVLLLISEDMGMNHLIS